MKAGGRQPLQLRDVAAALRKEDDVAGVLAALALVDGLLEAAPDELDQYAGALLKRVWGGFRGGTGEGGWGNC